MRALFVALNVSAFALTWIWLALYVTERARSRSLPPGMLSLFHRERAERAMKNAVTASALFVATAVGVMLSP